MSKIKARDEKDKEIFCSKCGTIFIGKRQRKDSICEFCLKKYYRDSAAIKRGEKPETIQETRNKKEKAWLRRWVKGLVNRSLGVTGVECDWITQKLLKKLEAQEFKCYYTGLPLVPSHNASLEHIKPRSTHPSLVKDVDNIVWIRIEVNSMRSNYSFERFVELCNICANSPVLLQLAQSEKEEREILQYEDYVI